MRLAFKKYEESNNLGIFNFVLAKEASSKADAVRMMFEKNLLPYYGDFNP